MRIGPASRAGKWHRGMEEAQSFGDAAAGASTDDPDLHDHV